MAKLTMQELANAAGVSRITVWKVLNDRPGVSDAMRDAVRRKAVEIGYLPDPTPAAHTRERTFSVAVARPESSTFWMQIIHHIAKELALSGVNMMYTYMPTTYREGYELPASLSPDNVDALLVLNVYDAPLLHLLAESPIPKVFLDSVPAFYPAALCGDLVLLESRTRIRDITARLISSGRTRLGFIGDAAYAQTNLDRYHGFLDAHANASITPDPRLSLTGPLGLHSHYAEIARFLDSLSPLPDAIVCASDFIAHFVEQYLLDTDRSVPTGFLLTGFDNSSEYPNVAEKITTVNVETSALGKLLARKLMFRADYPAAPYETSYIATDVIYRGDLADL